ncbi:MAG: prepilin-type N-terminal cleavage/methylation domain-containing protein [Candidatus Omnitrophica bacterium]|nr:prepilin-type N-terminal cleavage/methylation domain-containing protein [Candidatus Omnitrophota bacterium]
MHPKKTNIFAFTLTELLIVVVLLGVVAAFGVPNYTKGVNRSKEKDAVANLEMIRETVRLHISREGGTPPPALANVAAINSTLHLNIIEQEGNTYECLVQNIYTCRATNKCPATSVTIWQVQFQLDTNEGDVSCSFATCPTL